MGLLLWFVQISLSWNNSGSEENMFLVNIVLFVIDPRYRLFCFAVKFLA